MTTTSTEPDRLPPSSVSVVEGDDDDDDGVAVAAVTSSVATRPKTFRVGALAVKAIEHAKISARERRRGELLLADLNPDFDGDGRVSAFEQEVFEMFKAADRDGSGALNMREVYAVVKNSAQLRRTAGLLKKLLAGAIAVIAVLIACIGGMTAGLLDAYKDTEASGAFLSSRDGRVMQTSPAEYRVPLMVAPVLPVERLAQVGSLTVAYVDAAYVSNETVAAVAACLETNPDTLDNDDDADADGPSFEDVCGFADPRVRLSARVDSALRINATAVTFRLANSAATEVRVWNGRATLQMTDGGAHDVCESAVSCSALTLSDGANATALVAAAEDALAQAGFDPASASAGQDGQGAARRLRAASGLGGWSLGGRGRFGAAACLAGALGLPYGSHFLTTASGVTVGSASAAPPPPSPSPPPSWPRLEAISFPPPPPPPSPSPVTPSPSPPPPEVPSPAPPCTPTVQLNFNGGNGVTGWGGGTYTIVDRPTQAVVSHGGLSSGTTGNELLCLPDGCYAITTQADPSAPNMQFDLFEMHPNFNVHYINRPPGAYNFEVGAGCPPTCLPSETAVRVNMNGGNLHTGWGGGGYAITDRLAGGAHVLNGSLLSGYHGHDQFCLPDGCYTMTVSGGSSVAFDLVVNTAVLIDQPIGAYDFEIGQGCTPQCASDEALMRINMNGGLPSVGWDGATYQVDGTAIQGGLTTGYFGHDEICVPDGCHTLTVGGGNSDHRVTFDFLTLSKATNMVTQVHVADQPVGTYSFCATSS